MSTGNKYNIEVVRPAAERLLADLTPHCEKIAIAGSIRREKPEVGDIEIVLIPKPYETGLFLSGIALVINRLTKVKGELPCKYTQRELRLDNGQVIKCDFFIVTPEAWGLQLAVRTGSAEYSHYLATQWVAKGYHSEGGVLWKDGRAYPSYTEEDFFARVGEPWIEPSLRFI